MRKPAVTRGNRYGPTGLGVLTLSVRGTRSGAEGIRFADGPDIGSLRFAFGAGVYSLLALLGAARVVQRSSALREHTGFRL
jgi:hypothetical protein